MASIYVQTVDGEQFIEGIDSRQLYSVAMEQWAVGVIAVITCDGDGELLSSWGVVDGDGHWRQAELHEILSYCSWEIFCT